MRLVRVTSVDPACGSDCPEWISAEGLIRLGAAAEFERTLADLKGRRLPVLISSHGGSVADAVKIGALIRAHRLAVAVAHTRIANCPERAPECPDARGQATTAGAVCASACALVLAGGVERLVASRPEVGVHQMTTVMREIEGAARLPAVKKIYEEKSADTAVEAYLDAMGIGEPVMTLLRKTPPSSIRWLSPDEITASRLATEALDGAEPILTSGANGLNGHGLGADGAPVVLEAKGSATFSGASAEPATLEATFRYRPGGGTVEASLDAHGAAGAAGAARNGWTLTAPDVDAPPLFLASAGAAGGLLPREGFCALMRAGKIVAKPAGLGAEAEAAFDVAAIEEVTALVDEACP